MPRSSARREADRERRRWSPRFRRSAIDRRRLADSLDGETARSRKLEATNREIAQRLDTAIASIQSVLERRRVGA